ncbi:hypothetical protein VCRA2123O444_40139 [Vibrio crassostreae]|nr:hypothetical protein VCRA2114O422_40087 [Vibrio crassostreae]CAK2120263.1 hypothetical protein VCRA2119O431_40087 [Vibrio crassostreae]CAK2126260.1 hypothetical protein VCRA2113O409_50089 [Vibrio crassostreae]CAK2127226.1 hypothetical protein VCRA2113O412_50087 [Vibrio crassostreae]CAK2128092.1 hypothetical protein VCRA2113O414_50087 [Vibrio crassostreae]
MNYLLALKFGFKTSLVNLVWINAMTNKSINKQFGGIHLFTRFLQNKGSNRNE